MMDTSIRHYIRALKGALMLCALSLATAAAAQDTGADFRALPVVSSHGGVLETTLVAEQKDVLVDGVKIPGYVFNGEYGGPVLRLKPGDTLKLHLVNHIDQAINLHFHGSHASPLANSDNVHVVVEPGKSFDYLVKTPLSQPPGLYWYHTHIHGSAETLTSRGLSGAMIVEGLEDRVPEAKGLRQRLLVLKSYTAEAGDDPDLKRLHGVVQSINGQGHTDVTASAGSTELWRISNQSANDYIHLSIKGLKFRIIALDGAATGNDLPVDKVDIGPAMRVELLVDMPAAGDYALMSGSTLTGLGRSMKTSRELALLHVTGDGAPRDASAAPRAMTTPDLRQAKISANRTLVFGQKPGEEVYTINGLVFDHMRTDMRVPLGSVEEWTIRNDTDDMHSFHIHQVHFQVVSINGEPQPFDRMLDTVRLPERGKVVVRIAFTDPQIVGRFMIHCHVLKHEDRGMMQMIEVFDPKAPAKAPAMAPGMVMGPHDHMAP